MNDGYGKALREWILFVLGVAMIAGLTAKWFITGESPDPYLGGIALCLVGFGNMILQRGGPG